MFDVVTGEFGRSGLDKNLGRHHQAKLCPLVLAGGGLEHAQVVGRSDRRGSEPASEPVTIADLHATIMHARLGVGRMRAFPPRCWTGPRRAPRSGSCSRETASGRSGARASRRSGSARCRRPPARARNTGGPSADWNRCTTSSRRLRGVPPCRNSTSRAKVSCRCRRMMSPISVSCVNTSALSPASSNPSGISVSRASLPDRTPNPACSSRTAVSFRKRCAPAVVAVNPSARRAVLNGRRLCQVLPDAAEGRQVRRQSHSVRGRGEGVVEAADPRAHYGQTDQGGLRARVRGRARLVRPRRAYATNITIDTKRGPVYVYMVQHAGFPGNGNQCQGAFRKAAEGEFGTKQGREAAGGVSRALS